MSTLRSFASIVALATLVTTGCADGNASLLGPEAAVMSNSTEGAAQGAGGGEGSCDQVFVEGVAALGPVEVAPGIYSLGALPTPATIGGVSGLLSSVVTGMTASGSRMQGAQHLTLRHFFTSPEGTFMTTDRAVCVPSGLGDGICRVSDVLTVVSGTGIFAGASGSFRNHGVIDLNTYTVTINLRGRICRSAE